MNFPFYIARRYLFSKKSHNAINVISAISVCGVALATLALVCTLSVFNGFQDLVASFFTAFDPELKITAVRGKVFDGQDPRVLALKQLPEVAVYSQGRQAMAVIKGVEDNFDRLTPIDSILFGRGSLTLHDEVADYAIPGIQLLSALGSGIRFLDPLEIYAPKRGAKVNVANPSAAFCERESVLVGLGLCGQPGEIRRFVYPDVIGFCAAVVPIRYRGQFGQSAPEAGCGHRRGKAQAPRPSGRRVPCARPLRAAGGYIPHHACRKADFLSFPYLYFSDSLFQCHRFALDAHHRQARRRGDFA